MGTLYERGGPVKRKMDVFGILIASVAGIATECLWIIITLPALWTVRLPLWLVVLVGIALGGLVGWIVLILRHRFVGVNFDLEHLPASAASYIKLVIKYMHYRRIARQEVADELTDHFEQALEDCHTDPEKQKQAQQLIDSFGDPKLLAVLLRRAKKRCRPLWMTLVARGTVAAVILVVSFALYVVWFVSGKPIVKIDYLVLINQMKRPDAFEADNGWPHYEKAISLLVEPKWNSEEAKIIRSADKSVYTRFSNVDANEQQMLRKWIAQNENAWQEYVKGGRKPYCFKKVDYPAKDAEKWIYFIPLPEVSSLKYLCYLGLWRARILADEGKIKNALDDLLNVARAGRQWQSSFFPSYLAGIAVTRDACRDILGLLATYDVNDRELSWLATEISELFAEGYPEQNMGINKLVFLDLVQHLFTDSGPGGGHLIPSKLSRVADQLEQLPVKKRPYQKLIEDFPQYKENIGNIMLTSYAMSHALRNETVQKAEEVFDRVTRISRMTPYQRKEAGLNDKMAIYSNLPIRKYLIIHLFQPEWIVQASEIRFKFKATYEAVETILAALLWQRANGNFPQRLEQLTESGYLTALPADPYSNTTLIYRRTDKGFILYSVGPNFTDESGKTVPDDTDDFKMWYELGDKVFWPVEKN